MSDTAFFPDTYKLPVEGGNYLKFKDGDNRFRILSSPVFGWVDWDDNKKVYRTKTREEQPEKSRSNKPDAKIKHFWALVVWNYEAKKIQILEITQATVQKAIRGLDDDVDWGKPTNYDILVKRVKENDRTSYTVNPKPKSDLSDEILKSLSQTRVNLEALFSGADPFNSSPMNEDVDPNFMNEHVK